MLIEILALIFSISASIAYVLALIFFYGLIVGGKAFDILTFILYIFASVACISGLTLIFLTCSKGVIG